MCDNPTVLRQQIYSLRRQVTRRTSMVMTISLLLVSAASYVWDTNRTNAWLDLVLAVFGSGLAAAHFQIYCKLSDMLRRVDQIIVDYQEEP
jgi:hypothetical protein